MQQDLYLQAYETTGLDIIQISMQALMTGQLSKYGHHNYDGEQMEVCLAISPHLAGLFAEIWNIQEVPPHDIFNAHEGQLQGNETASKIADKISDDITASDFEFIVESTSNDKTDAEVSLYFASIVEKIKDDLCSIIKHTAAEKRDAMRKLALNTPRNEKKGPKAPEPKPPGYDVDSDPYSG